MTGINSKYEMKKLCGLFREEHSAYSILVMDDDRTVRELLALMLENLGYGVNTCINGEEAITLYSNALQNGSPYLTVIMDLTVEDGMGGKDAAEQILLIDPDARLVVSSGYSDDPVLADHKSYGFHSSLPKPYRLSGLAEVITKLHSL